MKILNLYSGIGGNRKLWTPKGNEHEITAVEYKKEIADIYQDFFPNDKIIIADAHQYLLDNFENFDFIWSSPPCQSHSKCVYSGTYSKDGKMLYRPKYTDIKLYQEILLLQGFFKGKWVVENVISWHKPLLPAQELASHYYWSNFYIPPLPKVCRGHDSGVETLQKIKGFDLSKYKGKKKLYLRNAVEPETGKYILDRAIKQEYQKLL